MSQTETLKRMIGYFANENLTVDEEVVVVLINIAQSLAIIADTLGKGGEDNEK